MRLSIRQARRGAVAVVGTVLGCLVVLAQPAEALAGVSNPGPFTTTILDGSSLSLSGGDSFSIGTPACDDGVDNDLTEGIDTIDPDCTDATDDNERVAGTQPFVAPTVDIDVDAAGVITFDPADLDFPPGELCTDPGFGVWCLSTEITGSGSVVTGSIDPALGTVSLPLTVTVELAAVQGFSGFNNACFVGPVSGTLTASNYDDGNGQATLAASGLTVPAITVDCGDFIGIVEYNTAINTELGLPGTAAVSLLTETLNGADQPVLP